MRKKLYKLIKNCRRSCVHKVPSIKMCVCGGGGGEGEGEGDGTMEKSNTMSPRFSSKRWGTVSQNMIIYSTHM